MLEINDEYEYITLYKGEMRGVKNVDDNSVTVDVFIGLDALNKSPIHKSVKYSHLDEDYALATSTDDVIHYLSLCNKTNQKDINGRCVFKGHVIKNYLSEDMADYEVLVAYPNEVTDLCEFVPLSFQISNESINKRQAIEVSKIEIIGHVDTFTKEELLILSELIQ